MFFQVLHTLEGVGVMVLAELWFALLSQRGAVAGGLGVHPVIGQPGNYEVPSALLTSFLCFMINPKLRHRQFCSVKRVCELLTNTY